MNDLTPQKLGKRIKELRKQAGLTQDELADKADVSYSSVAKLEQGKIDNPSFFTILELSRLLNSSPDQIAGLSIKTAPASSGGPKGHIKTVVFDVHGVLVSDWNHMFVDLAQRTNSDPHQVEEVFWRYDELVVDGTMNVNDFERAIAADLQADPNDIEYQQVYTKATQAFKPAHELLLELGKTYDIALMSNIFPDYAPLLLGTGALPQLTYRDMILSSTVKTAKPYDKIYEIAEERLGEPTSLLFIDDTAANIDTALKRGWQGVVYDQDNWEDSHQQIRQMLNQ